MAYFAPYIDGTGLHMPTYEDRLSDLVTAYRSIFGIDSELSESVPDYQLLSVFAKALDDTSALVLQAYNSRNPLYASGQALDLWTCCCPCTALPGRRGRTTRRCGSGSRIPCPPAGPGAWTRSGPPFLFASLSVHAKCMKTAPIRRTPTGSRRTLSPP